MENRNQLNKLTSPINISKLPANSSTTYHLDKTQDWVKELLIELNEKAAALPQAMKLDQTRLSIELELERKFKGEFGEFLLCTGRIEAHFFTECVKTLVTMKDSLEVEFKAMFLDSSFESKPEYEELTEYFHDQDVYELYYFERRMVNIKNLMHEVIYLNINPYPSREEVSEETQDLGE